MKLSTVISGVANEGELDFLWEARYLGLRTGGVIVWDGSFEQDDLKPLGVRPLPRSGTRSQRNMSNAKNSDATLVLRASANAGVDKTIGYCLGGTWSFCGHIPVSEVREYSDTKFKPVLIIPGIDRSTVNRTRAFLEKHEVRVLNVLICTGSAWSKYDMRWLITEAMGGVDPEPEEEEEKEEEEKGGEKEKMAVGHENSIRYVVKSSN